MNGQLVSVVIPTHNRADCLCACIDSALAQSYPNVEILIIDDGSQDGTGDMVKRMYGNDARIRYIYQANRGVAAARNHGLRIAKGEFVALLDSDDAWKPWKLEVQMAVMAHLSQVGMVWTDMEAVDKDGVVWDPKHLRTMYHAYRWFPTPQYLFAQSSTVASIATGICAVEGKTGVYWGDIFSAMIMGNLVHTSTVLMRQDRVARAGGFPEHYRVGEDYDFHLRICRDGPVAFIDAASIRYQTGRGDQLTHLTHPRYRVHMAANFLKTIRPVLEKDRSRITLPQSVITAMLGDAYYWLGEMLLEQGKRRLARRWLFQSLLLRPFQSRVLRLAVLSMLMPHVADRLRWAARSLKRLRCRGGTP